MKPKFEPHGGPRVHDRNTSFGIAVAVDLKWRQALQASAVAHLEWLALQTQSADLPATIIKPPAVLSEGWLSIPAGGSPRASPLHEAAVRA
jgi:hypothetical protein